MHVENEAGPSRPKTPPTLPPRPLQADISAHSAPVRPGHEHTTISVDDGASHADQMMIDAKGDELYYRTYRGEAEDLSGVKRLIDQELSEPYTVYTFRYFLNEWPHLTFLVFPSPESTIPIATIMCKQESHRGKTNRGYIGMLSVDKSWRRRGIASKLVELAISEMKAGGAHEIALETEYDNKGSLALYDSIGFLREKRIHGFYSNLKDAFRLILPLPSPADSYSTYRPLSANQLETKNEIPVTPDLTEEARDQFMDMYT